MFKDRSWNIQHYEGETLTIEAKDLETKTPVFIENCKDTTVKINGKCNAIRVSKCVNTKVQFESVVSMCEVFESNKITVLSLKACPTFIGENSNQVQLYLQTNHANCEIYTMAVNEFNVAHMQENETWTEAYPIPLRFKTVWNEEKKSYVTIVDEEFK